MVHLFFIFCHCFLTLMLLGSQTWPDVSQERSKWTRAGLIYDLSTNFYQGDTFARGVRPSPQNIVTTSCFTYTYWNTILNSGLTAFSYTCIWTWRDTYCRNVNKIHMKCTNWTYPRFAEASSKSPEASSSCTHFRQVVRVAATVEILANEGA